MKEKYNELSLRKCTLLDVDQICDFQKIIINGLKDKKILRENSRNMFEKCVQNPNLAIGVFDTFKLVALAILVDERGKDEDLSCDLVKHKVSKAANLKLVMVSEEYRGNGFQRALMWLLEKNAYDNGFTHLCTTVSNKNVYSLNNIINAGYEYDHSAIKYGGLAREIYIKDIKSDVSLYNLDLINSIKNMEKYKETIAKNINSSKWFEGDPSIATSGDVLEYEDIVSGKKYYALLVKKFTTMAFIYIKNGLQCIKFLHNISGMKLQKVWIIL